MFRSGNPALNESIFRDAAREVDSSNVMTIGGTVGKSFVMLALILLSASFTWRMVLTNPSVAMIWCWGGLIAGIILALITIFAKQYAGVTAPLYAVAQGLFLGTISSLFDKQFQGIIIQAVLLTFGVFGVMLILYTQRVLRATPKFVMGVVAATGAIMLAYLVSFVLQMFGIQMPFLHSNGPIGIGISVVIVIIAALNLILDFDIIERGAADGAPKWMEWYASFALMVTLIWLYLEILRLLSKLNRR